MTRIGFDLLSFAASTLVHIYTLCGNIEKTRHVFNEMLRPDLVLWTSLIIGYVQNAQADEALQFSGLLFKSRTQPDHITFVGVPSICTHVGLADKGLEYFHSIKENMSLHIPLITMLVSLIH